jgi:hypothetical protein
MREFAFWGQSVRAALGGETSLGLGILKEPDETQVLKEIANTDDARDIVHDAAWSAGYVRNFNRYAPYWSLESGWLADNFGVILPVKLFLEICANHDLGVLFKRAKGESCR